MSYQTMMIGQQTTLSTGAVVAAYRVGDDRTLFRFQSAGSETAVALTDEAVVAPVQCDRHDLRNPHRVRTRVEDPASARRDRLWRVMVNAKRGG